MNKIRAKTLFAVGLAFGCLSGVAQGEMEFNSMMMESTFKIEGPAAQPGKKAVGTGFLLAKASTNRPGQILLALVTANHVFSDITGSNATLVLRERDTSGIWRKTNFNFQIRSCGTNLWLNHPRVDLAAIWIRIPSGIVHEVNAVERMLSGVELQRFEIHPGDRLNCLGYPLGLEANDAGFPILRTGTIASYPLLPVTNNPTFMFDFNVFDGNSGGPVYLVDANRFYGGGTHAGEVIHGLVGVVVEQV